MDPPGSITQLLRRCHAGDQAAWKQIIPILYDDLRRIARQRLRSDRDHPTLGTTALVNECYLRLIEQRELGLEDRNGFLAVASQIMRRVLVDYARARNRQKRGGADKVTVPFHTVEEWLTRSEADEILALDEALDQLKVLDERACQVVEFRFFGGLSVEETAQVLGISTKTIQRTWISARAWLRKEISRKGRRATPPRAEGVGNGGEDLDYG